MTPPNSGTIPPKTGTEPEMCARCGRPLRPTETWFRVQKGSPPEPLRICTSCAMAKTPGKVQL